MASGLLRISLSPHRNLSFSYDSKSNVHGFGFRSLPQRRRSQRLSKVSGGRAPNFNYFFAKAVDVGAPAKSTPLTEEQQRRGESSVLLDVTGMMCGACVARVKSVLSADKRVESAVVNMVTETAAVRVRPEVVEEAVGESLARKLTECGFPTKERVPGTGVEENVRKWREMAEKKEELLVKSRNRVAFAWALVALCCGSHASHILHSLGIHVAHGKYIALTIELNTVW